MIESIQLAIGLVGLLFTWSVVVRKTVLDARRDQLFDLRDDVRKFFVHHHISLDSKEYRQLRDLINGYLRYTEEMSLSGFSWFAGEISRNGALEAYLAKKLEHALKTDNEHLREFICETRNRASEVAANYVVEKSGAAMFFVVLMVMFVLPYQLVVKPLFEYCRSVLKQLPPPASVDDCMHPHRSEYRKVRNKIVGKIVDKTELEEGAYLFGQNRLQAA